MFGQLNGPAFFWIKMHGKGIEIMKKKTDFSERKTGSARDRRLRKEAT